MRRIISFLGSDKVVCRYYDNGYCRFETKCRFVHPKENCNQKKCQNSRCEKRHPKPCRFYEKKKCRFDAECKFKHEINENDENANQEAQELKEKLRNSDDIIENLKKELAMKDFVIAAKDDNIKKNEGHIRILLFENKDLKKCIENQNQSEIGGIKCKNCEKMFKTEVDLYCLFITLI